MALIGYARTSTTEQQYGLAAQRDELTAAGCEKVFHEHGSGVDRDRPELAALMNYVREGDVVVVVGLDRLGRSLSHLVRLVDGFRANGIQFRSLREGISTDSDAGLLVFHVFSAIAEFERSLIRSRTKMGLQQAKLAGRQGGRPRALDAEKTLLARSMRKGGASLKQIQDALGVSRSTVSRAIREPEAVAS